MRNRKIVVLVVSMLYLSIYWNLEPEIGSFSTTIVICGGRNLNVYLVDFFYAKLCSHADQIMETV